MEAVQITTAFCKMLAALQALLPHINTYRHGLIHDPAVAMWADENTEALFSQIESAVAEAKCETAVEAELLEALIKIYRGTSDEISPVMAPLNYREVRIIAKAAIAKATGEKEGSKP